MTKFRNGNSVEALRREHDPCGSWFPASVVSVDGNEYVVRYKFLMDNKGEPVLEKVHGEGIRPPPPPPPQMGKRWKVGDIAEVFDNQCWRIGKIAKVLQKNWFVIRLFGSIRLKEFHETNIRIRKSWHNNKWSVIGKVKTCVICINLACFQTCHCSTVLVFFTAGFVIGFHSQLFNLEIFFRLTVLGPLWSPFYMYFLKSTYAFLPNEKTQY